MKNLLISFTKAPIVLVMLVLIFNPISVKASQYNSNSNNDKKLNADNSAIFCDWWDTDCQQRQG